MSSLISLLYFNNEKNFLFLFKKNVLVKIEKRVTFKRDAIFSCIVGRCYQ